MPKFANFVQCTLVSAITAGGLIVEVEAQAPFNLPPDPAGEKAYLTLMDDVNSPTAFEIISYTGTNSTGATTVELTGVTRAEQGTAARAWDAEVVCRQDVTAKSLDRFPAEEFTIYAAGAETNIIEVNSVGEARVFSSALDNDVEILLVAPDAEVYAQSGSQAVRLSRDGEILDFETLVTDRIVAVTASHVITEDNSTGRKSLYDRDLTFVSEAAAYLDSFTLYANKFAPKNIWGIDVSGGNGNYKVTLFDVALNPIAEWNPTETNILETSFGAVGAAQRDGSFVFGSDRNDSGGALQYKILSINEYGSVSEIFQSTLEGVLSETVNEFEVFDGHTVVIQNGDGQVVSHETGLELYTFSISGGFGDIATISENRIVALTQDAGTVDPVDPKLKFYRESTQEWVIQPSVSTVLKIAVWNPSGKAIFTDGFELTEGPVNLENVAGQPTLNAVKRFNELSGVQTPPSGRCYVYLDSADGAYKVKFDTGTVKTLATP